MIGWVAGYWCISACGHTSLLTVRLSILSVSVVRVVVLGISTSAEDHLPRY